MIIPIQLKRQKSSR